MRCTQYEPAKIKQRQNLTSLRNCVCAHILSDPPSPLCVLVLFTQPEETETYIFLANFATSALRV